VARRAGHARGHRALAVGHDAVAEQVDLPAQPERRAALGPVVGRAGLYTPQVGPPPFLVTEKPGTSLGPPTMPIKCRCVFSRRNGRLHAVMGRALPGCFFTPA
jgi:hypothetical protein